MITRLEPAAIVSLELMRKISKASFDKENEWYFYDGAYTATLMEHNLLNTWTNENFAIILGDTIIGYIESGWTRPVDIISTFRFLLFDKANSYAMAKGFFIYLEYIFERRGCQAFNFTVALKNENRLREYDRFILRYCGHKVGCRSHAQKSYSGTISDICLYEITREEYFDWKNRNLQSR